MLSGVTHPHSHSVHHLPGESWGSGLCGSCAFQLCASVCLCNQFCLDVFHGLFMHMCTVCINILSVNLSILTHTMCLCTKCLFYVCIKSVCVCVLYACSVYMLCLLQVAHLVLLCGAAQPAL